MGRFILFIAFIVFLNYSWPTIEGQVNKPDNPLSGFITQINELKEKQEVKDLSASLSNLLNHGGLLAKEILEGTTGEPSPPPLEKVELKKPGKLFSVYNLEIGSKREAVERQLGAEKRSTQNEYGANWNAYHKDYQQFVMVMYDKNNTVSGLFTNQDLIASTLGVKNGTPKTIVREKLGTPLTTLKKGWMLYKLESDEYDVFLKDGVYVTVFYDKHEDNTVTALQLIRQDVEDNKTDIYTKNTPGLKEGFELQMFDLTNSTRLQHRLPLLTWDDHVRETARKHSADMAAKNYFSHTNLDGQSPFDRMEADNVRYNLAGENLAYGQFSSIFAHEGLMNSLGHRKNILQKGFEYLGVGVAFNGKSQPYYTQNYYAN